MAVLWRLVQDRKGRFVEAMKRFLKVYMFSEICELVESTSSDSNSSTSRRMPHYSRCRNRMFTNLVSSIISSGPASACAPAIGAPHTDSQCLPVSELVIISTLATAKPRAEPEAGADSKNFDTNGAFQAVVDVGCGWRQWMTSSTPKVRQVSIFFILRFVANTKGKSFYKYISVGMRMV